MSTQGVAANVTLFVESRTLPGQLGALRSLICEVCAHWEATEPGLLRYEWFVDESEETVRVVEIYRDAEALAFHGQNYAPFQPRLAACREVRRMTICGDLPVAMAERMRDLGATLVAPIDGLVR